MGSLASERGSRIHFPRVSYVQKPSRSHKSMQTMDGPGILGSVEHNSSFVRALEITDAHAWRVQRQLMIL